jgi:hypothetical protein
VLEVFLEDQVESGALRTAGAVDPHDGPSVAG